VRGVYATLGRQEGAALFTSRPFPDVATVKAALVEVILALRADDFETFDYTEGKA